MAVPMKARKLMKTLGLLLKWKLNKKIISYFNKNRGRDNIKANVA